MPETFRGKRNSPLNQDPACVTRAREWAGMSKTQLRQSMTDAGHPIALSLLTEIESGARNATPSVLAAIASALNCPVSMLERKREDVAS